MKKLNPIKLKQMEDEVEAAETEIMELEEKIAAAEERLGVFTSAEESQKASAEVERLRGEHAKVQAGGRSWGWSWRSSLRRFRERRTNHGNDKSEIRGYLRSGGKSAAFGRHDGVCG